VFGWTDLRRFTVQEDGFEGMDSRDEGCLVDLILEDG